jgi:hypothetical protein
MEKNYKFDVGWFSGVSPLAGDAESGERPRTATRLRPLTPSMPASGCAPIGIGCTNISI